MKSIRPAMSDQSKILTDISTESELYWGYNPKFINSFKKLYKLKEETILYEKKLLIEIFHFKII